MFDPYIVDHPFWFLRKAYIVGLQRCGEIRNRNELLWEIRNLLFHWRECRICGPSYYYILLLLLSIDILSFSNAQTDTRVVNVKFLMASYVAMILTLSMLGKIFNRNIEIYILYFSSFSRNRFWHFVQIFYIEDNLHELSSPVFFCFFFCGGGGGGGVGVGVGGGGSGI